MYLLILLCGFWGYNLYSEGWATLHDYATSHSGKFTFNGENFIYYLFIYFCLLYMHLFIHINLLFIFFLKKSL